jgi:hypothetical protein
LKSACWFNVTVNGSQKTGLLDSFICEPWHFISSADEGGSDGRRPVVDADQKQRIRPDSDWQFFESLFRRVEVLSGFHAHESRVVFLENIVSGQSHNGPKNP